MFEAKLSDKENRGHHTFDVRCPGNVTFATIPARHREIDEKQKRAAVLRPRATRGTKLARVVSPASLWAGEAWLFCFPL
jgi:hypothetical protein